MSSEFVHTLFPNPSSIAKNKHVNFNLGMVLGVEDFIQEFTYHNHRNSWLARDLLGYGTIWGLRVAKQTDNRGPRVLIECGAALSPSGKLIHVSSARCNYIEEWMEANKNEILKTGFNPNTSPLSDLKVFAVLAYDDCKTDEVPIAGEACRVENDLTAPSRIQDHYHLRLQLQAPLQTEEEALRNFVAALVAVPVNSSSTTTLSEFEDEVRHSRVSLGSPISSPPAQDKLHCDFSFPQDLSIPSDNATEYLRAAFRIWVTELRPPCRPEWLANGESCGPQAPTQFPEPEEYIALAELSIPVTVDARDGTWRVTDLSGIQINEQHRPYVLHLRMLQEWLLSSKQTPYGVVAAGILKGNLSSDGPVKGGLRLIKAEKGKVSVTFDGYTKPDGSFQYMVKALPISPVDAPIPTVRFMTFKDTHFELGISNGATAFSKAEVTAISYMVEISRIA